ncbi:MAG: GNAT family N-acetyltransferase [Reyranella sp.]|uniref:GNAT family N-acetyltransferase n=1 Tax=Reyranella sp. TaxID=1929291 RepID=UPI00272FB3BD|nr:GNAT family N-acetyltransferase [Reyranella sp.]MDP1964939.1 GNAT family N-acetyltransferase [Reyranella sp.]MDP2373849.1 GNAT family N-acetyltransferase [Reyranella sp.]
MRIAPLVERPDLAAQVAAWGFAEWGHLNPGQTLEQRVIRIQGKMNVDRVPIAFVALDEDGGIVGTASLIFDDLEGDPRNPWLASVYVPPVHRKKGVASALVRTVEDAARRLGYTRLYLFTSTAPKLYADLGWRPLEQCDYRGDHIQIMDKTL